MDQLPNPPSLSEWQIRRKAHGLFWEYVSEVGESHLLNCGIDFNEVHLAVIYPRYEIELITTEDLGVDDDGLEILGEFLPKDRTALVSKRLFDNTDPRRVFTECHEAAGHGILHGPFLRKNALKYPKLFTTEKAISTSPDVFDWKKFNTFEWQANTFAANFFAPLGYVWALYMKAFGTNRKIKYTGPGKYCLCFCENSFYVSVDSPRNLAWQIAKQLKKYFWGLSTESLAYRVLEVVIDKNGYNDGDFFADSRSISSLGQIVSSMFEEA